LQRITFVKSLNFWWWQRGAAFFRNFFDIYIYNFTEAKSLQRQLASLKITVAHLLSQSCAACLEQITATQT
jgi:hypothetical protein